MQTIFSYMSLLIRVLQIAFEKSLRQISLCTSEISSWMTTMYLKLNPTKTEFMVLGVSNRYKDNIAQVKLDMNGHLISPSSTVMSLGVCIDSSFTLTSHVKLVVRTCNYHLRNLWRIRRYITVDACHHAVRALITSRLDYCNSLFTVLSTKDRKKLEIIQNRAARLIFRAGRRTHTTPLLQELHWLPLQKRISYKLCLYVYKILQQLCPHLS